MAATSKGTHALPNYCIEDIKEENVNTNCDNDTSLKEDCSGDELTYCGTARIEFNQGRKIQIKDIPPISKTQDIEEFLKDFKVTDISLDLNAGQAIVTLENGLDAELIVSELNEKEIDGSKVCVCILPCTNLLVIAHLPKHFTDKDLSDLLSKYKTVEKCFMMRFEQTDMSLQYGVVCFKDSVERSNAKEEFDWSLIEGCHIHAEFIDICCNYDDLFSRCLFIDNLPKSFKEAYKLREIFNCVASPVYCQIMVRDNESLGYGIIEYKKYWEARETWYKLQDYTLDGVVINITFCVPDKPAVSIFNRIIRKLDNKGKTMGSLLPDPIISNPITISNPLVKGLASQNPELMKSFMQALQHLQTSYLNQMATPSTKPGLLGPVPSMPTSPAMNPNMQLGLMIFLATHMQNKVNQQFTGPLAAQLNILQKLGQQKNIPDTKPPGDPLTAQANVVIQTLKAQVRGKTTPTPLMASTTESSTAFFQQILQNTRDLNLNLLMNLGQIMSNIQNKKTESLMSKNISPPQNGLFPTPAYSPTHSNNNSKYIRSTDMPPPNRYPFLHSNIQNNIHRQYSATPRPLMDNFPINSGNRQNNATSPIPLLGEMQHNTAKPLSLLGDIRPITAPKPLSLLGDIRQHNSPRPLSLLGDIRQHNSPRPLSLLGDIRQHNSPRPLSLLGDIRQHDSPRPLSLLGDIRQHDSPRPLSLLGDIRQHDSPRPLSLLGDIRQHNSPRPLSLLGETRQNKASKPLSLLGDIHPVGAQPSPLFGDQMTQKPLSLLGEPPVNLHLQQNVNKVHNIGEYKRQHGSESSGYGGRGSYSGGQDYGQYDSGYWPDTPDGMHDDPFQDLPNTYKPITDYQNSRRDDKIPSLLSAINQNSNNSNYSNRSTTQSVFQPSNNEQQYQYGISSTSNYRSNNSNVTLLNPNSSYQNPTQSIEYNHDSDKDGLLSTPRNPIINSNRSDNGLFSVPRSMLNSTYKTEYNTNSTSTLSENSLMKPNSLMPGLMDLNDNRNVSSFSYKPSKSSSNQGYNIIGTNQFNKHSQDNSTSLDYSNRGYTSNSRLLKTPVGQKRSYSQLLPAPEPSPEGSYIGQHSQGLGGHYADSYSKRIKLDYRFQ